MKKNIFVYNIIVVFHHRFYGAEVLLCNDDVAKGTYLDSAESLKRKCFWETSPVVVLMVTTG